MYTKGPTLLVVKCDALVIEISLLLTMKDFIQRSPLHWCGALLHHSDSVFNTPLFYY